MPLKVCDFYNFFIQFPSSQKSENNQFFGKAKDGAKRKTPKSSLYAFNSKIYADMPVKPFPGP